MNQGFITPEEMQQKNVWRYLPSNIFFVFNMGSDKFAIVGDKEAAYAVIEQVASKRG